MLYFGWIICTHNSYLENVNFNSFLFKERYVNYSKQLVIISLTRIGFYILCSSF